MSITRIKKGQIIDYMLEQILTSKNVIFKGIGRKRGNKKEKQGKL